MSGRSILTNFHFFRIPNIRKVNITEPSFFCYRVCGVACVVFQGFLHHFWKKVLVAPLWSDAVPKGELKMLSISKAGLILSICLSALINISLGKWFLNLLVLFYSGNLVWSDWTQSISYLLLTYCLYWFAFLK